jgi:hypothetical protein
MTGGMESSRRPNTNARDEPNHFETMVPGKVPEAAEQVPPKSFGDLHSLFLKSASLHGL